MGASLLYNYMAKRRKVLELFNALLFGMTLVGANFVQWLQTKSHIQVPVGWQLATSVVLGGLYFWVAYEKGVDKTHEIEEGTQEFYDFFEQWYSQEGYLSIYCSDLDWLDDRDGRGASVVRVLERKGDKLHLYLRRTKGRVVNRLRKRGAKVYRIKASIKTRHRFSLLEQDGIWKVIIRNKDIEKDRIVFIETDSANDPYLIGLAQDLLDDCCLEI